MHFFLAGIDSLNITNYIEITQSVMPKPVSFDDCAGGSQAVQLLDGPNTGQI